jgi:hypothetical protein
VGSRLLRDIKGFYDTELHELIDPGQLPNLMAIAKEAAAGELEKLVLLLLACAVQCDRRDVLVGRIMGLDAEPQRVLMMLITQVRATACPPLLWWAFCSTLTGRRCRMVARAAWVAPLRRPRPLAARVEPVRQEAVRPAALSRMRTVPAD